MPVDRIVTADVLKVLAPHWVEKHATMAKTAQYMGRVFDRAVAEGYCASNPADCEGAAFGSAARQVNRETPRGAHAGRARRRDPLSCTSPTHPRLSRTPSSGLYLTASAER